jgi:hypothetical protein
MSYYELDSIAETKANAPKNYIDMEIDAMWVEDSFLPACLTTFCGTCNSKWGRGCQCEVAPKLGCVALHHSVWKDPLNRRNTTTAEEVGMVDVLRITEAKELATAVEDLLHTDDRDVILLKPRPLPWQMLPKLAPSHS